MYVKCTYLSGWINIGFLGQKCDFVDVLLSLSVSETDQGLHGFHMVKCRNFALCEEYYFSLLCRIVSHIIKGVFLFQGSVLIGS